MSEKISLDSSVLFSFSFAAFAASLRLIDKRRRHTFDFKKAIDIGKRDRTDKGLSGRKGFGSEGTLYPILEANAGGMFPLYGRYGSGARCTA